jgi:hypothetical protein
VASCSITVSFSGNIGRDAAASIGCKDASKVVVALVLHYGRFSQIFNLKTSLPRPSPHGAQRTLIASQRFYFFSRS